MNLGSELKEYGRQVEESADGSVVPDVAPMAGRSRGRRRVARTGGIALAAAAVVAISVVVTASSHGGSAAEPAVATSRPAGIDCGDTYAIRGGDSTTLALLLTVPTRMTAGDSLKLDGRLVNVGGATATVRTGPDVRLVVVRDDVVVGYRSGERGSLIQATLSPGHSASYSGALVARACSGAGDSADPRTAATLRPGHYDVYAVLESADPAGGIVTSVGPYPLDVTS